ncbi:hypothetical protein BAE44_0024645 [Dichanthelium oligosanthes]|uniref:DUF6598 domain-containing protein n=1 Tax=Dichanthelium oligosanthes TaxID=888268 RepID=A0A1E5UNA4_9POAL|nr:hypothetical protein BAE44_0024645 [Dichanthelium oligosanthes]
MHLLTIEEREERIARYREAEKRILDYDPKQAGAYYTRIYLVRDLASFDHDVECPKRGLALISNTYVETNLIIKGDQGQEERQLSKGLLTIPGIERRVLTKCELESCSLATRLSTVDVMYGVVKAAVEATISIEVLAGEFFGEITACTSIIKEKLVLHDRSAYITSGEGIALIIPLLRSVVAVYVKEKLLLTIAAHTDGEFTKCIDYTPRVNSSYLDEVTVGLATLRVKFVCQ